MGAQDMAAAPHNLAFLAMGGGRRAAARKPPDKDRPRSPSGQQSGHREALLQRLHTGGGRPTESWNHIMSLARRLTLYEDHTLGIQPVSAIGSLRFDHKHVGQTPLPANQEVVLEGIEGNTIELSAEIDPKDAREPSIHVGRVTGCTENHGTSSSAKRCRRRLARACLWSSTQPRYGTNRW